MGKTLFKIEKGIYLLISFIAVIFFLYLFKIWAYDWGRYFSFTGDLESWAVVIIVSTIIIFVLEKLWTWEVHQIFNPKRRRR